MWAVEHEDFLGVKIPNRKSASPESTREKFTNISYSEESFTDIIVCPFQIEYREIDFGDNLKRSR